MKHVALCFLVPAFIVAACHRNNTDQTHDALAALRSNTPNQQYGPAFWSDEYLRKTDLWQRALVFCSRPEHLDSANCQQSSVKRRIRVQSAGWGEAPTSPSDCTRNQPKARAIKGCEHEQHAGLSPVTGTISNHELNRTFISNEHTRE
jgi:hypothetical protein